MDINQATDAVERFVTGYADASKRKARELKVHPSGDDPTHIKVWVDLGPGVDDAACHAWAAACKAALAEVTGAYTVEVRAESL